MRQTIFGSIPSARRTVGWGDALALLVVLVVLYMGTRLAFNAPAVVAGPTIDLSPRALP